MIGISGFRMFAMPRWMVSWNVDHSPLRVCDCFAIAPP
jgi:hypothetical protein